MATAKRSGHHGHKRIRLDPALYAQVGSVCSITIAVLDRRPIFSDTFNAIDAVDVMRKLSVQHRVPIFGYCLMPDHVHVVLGPSSSCDIITFVAQFKNLSQRAVWKRGFSGAFWQKSFWDHFVREEEGVESAVTYVVENPVRRGLVREWRDYPYAGSLALHL